MKSRIATIILVSFSLSIYLFTACNQREHNHAEHQHDDELVYACPMHPEVKGYEGEKCPKCGMTLVASDGKANSAVVVKLSTTPEKPSAGETVNLKFDILKDGKAAELELLHEKKVHFFIINESLTWFRHEHAANDQNGNYTIQQKFPSGGNYFIFTDFKPKGASPQVAKQEISISGAAGKETQVIQPKLNDQQGAFKVQLLGAEKFETGNAQEIRLSILKNGKSFMADDLENYLGAKAHIVLLDTEDKDLVHVHANDPKNGELSANATFKKAGMHRMWVQFMVDEQLVTADFTFSVNEADAANHQQGNQKEDHSKHQH